MVQPGLTRATSAYEKLLAGDLHITEHGTIALGAGALVRGTVLGKITKSTPTTGTATEGNTGNGTVTSVTAGSKTKIGAYLLTCKGLDAGTLTAPTTGTKTGTGNGTMTSVTAGAKAVAGTYKATCKSQTGGTLTVPTTGTKTGTGNGTMTSVSAGANVKAGTYKATCISAAVAEPLAAAVFIVQDPEGHALPNATAGVAYVNAQILFTITDGLTPFIVGDYFTVLAANGGLFSVKDPHGKALPDASVGVAYENEAINFTINDGSVDFIVGDYFTVLVGNAGIFSVKDPDGLALPDAIVGVAFANASINFTINDGSVDFAVGDSFTITVAAGSGHYKKALAAAVDGSQIPSRILGLDVDATSAAVDTTLYRFGEFASSGVTLGAGISLAVASDYLEQRGMYLK